VAELRTILDLPASSMRTLNASQSETLVRITLSAMSEEHADIDKAVSFSPDVTPPFPLDRKDLPFLMAVLTKRLQWCGGEYSAAAIMFASLSLSNPAESVMWAYALFRRWKESGPVTLNSLLEKTVLGEGIPTHEAMMELWDEQKAAECPLGNRLDSPATWGKESGNVLREAAVD
jgi:hypothetical protein